MRKIILQIGPIVLGYGCAVVGIVGIILDILKGDIHDMTLPIHILIAVMWLIVAIKWTVEYKRKKEEETED